MKEPKKNNDPKEESGKNESGKAPGKADKNTISQADANTQENGAVSEYTVNFSTTKNVDLFDEYNPWS